MKRKLPFMEVDLAELKRCVEYIRSINKEDFSSIKWMLGGTEKLPGTEDLQEVQEKFEFLGLCNTDYGKMLLGIF